MTDLNKELFETCKKYVQQKLKESSIDEEEIYSSQVIHAEHTSVQISVWGGSEVHKQMEVLADFFGVEKETIGIYSDKNDPACIILYIIKATKNVVGPKQVDDE